MIKPDFFKTLNFVTIFWSLCSAAYIAAVTFFDIPEDNQRVVDQVLGFLMGTVVATIMNFWLGSSVGSKVKPDNKEGAENVTDPREDSTNRDIG
jgi:putative flippase GtrA